MDKSNGGKNPAAPPHPVPVPSSQELYYMRLTWARMPPPFGPFYPHLPHNHHFVQTFPYLSSFPPTVNHPVPPTVNHTGYYNPKAPVNHPVPPPMHFNVPPPALPAFTGGAAGPLPISAAPPLPTAIAQNPALPVQLIMDLRKQLNYYFSLENLLQDIFLRKHMDPDGWVPAELMMKFNKMTELLAGNSSPQRQLLCEMAAWGCRNLEVSRDLKRWRPTTPPPRSGTWQLPPDMLVPEPAKLPQ